MNWYALFTYDSIFGRHYILTKPRFDSKQIQYNTVIIIPDSIMSLFAIKHGHFLQNAIVGFIKLETFSNVVEYLTTKIGNLDMTTLTENINDILILDIDDVIGVE